MLAGGFKHPITPRVPDKFLGRGFVVPDRVHDVLEVGKLPRTLGSSDLVPEGLELDQDVGHGFSALWCPHFPIFHSVALGDEFCNTFGFHDLINYLYPKKNF